MTEQSHAIEATIMQAKETGFDPSAPNPNAPNPSVTDTSVADTHVPNASVADWREGLPDEFKNAPSLAKFKDQASLVKSYLEGEKALSTRVAIPKEDATETEWDTFYKKIGRPEDKRYRPDSLSIGEDEEPILARYEEILHASGLTKKQGQKVLSHMAELSAQMEAESKARDEAVRTENLKILENAFGDQMDVKMRQIQAALGQFEADASVRQGLAALVEQTNYHPALVQFLSRVGEKLASDRLVTGDSPKLSTARQNALDEIKKLESDEDFQVNYRGSDFDKRQEAVNRMNDLYKIAYQTSDI